MPFKPGWANKVTAVARAACGTAGVDYIRDKQIGEPNVIRSIWEELARATHVLVDLTGFSPNVALELGIAYALGKNVLIMGQADPKEHVFVPISRVRVQSYNLGRIDQTLGDEVRKFLSAVQ